MTDTEKLNLLIDKLKEFAEAKHCYDEDKDYDYNSLTYSPQIILSDGVEYGEINLARTLLEIIGVEFVYPCMQENETEEQFTTPIVPDETMQWMVQNFGEN